MVREYYQTPPRFFQPRSHSETIISLEKYLVHALPLKHPLTDGRLTHTPKEHNGRHILAWNLTH
jgi:hypothetical protein